MYTKDNPIISAFSHSVICRSGVRYGVNQLMRALLLGAAFLTLWMPQGVRAANYWKDINSVWNTGANWSTGAKPLSTEVAAFTNATSYGFPPTPTANSVGQIDVSGAADLTFNAGALVLTLGGVSVSGTYVGLYMESTAGNVNFNTTRFTLANQGQSFRNDAVGKSMAINGTAIANGGFLLTLDGGGGDITFSSSSIISGTGGMTVNRSGSGVVTIAGANTFGGAGKTFELKAGTLNYNSTKTVGAALTTFQIDGGTTIDNTSGAAITSANNNPLMINGDFTFTGAADATHNLNLGTGATTLGTAEGTSRTITVSGAGSTLTLGGIISDGATATNLIKSGAGNLTLSGANYATYSGNVIVLSGMLKLGGAFTAGSTPLGPANVVQVNTGATFDAGGNVTIAGLNDNNGAAGTVTDSGNGKTLTLGGSGTYSFAGTITNGVGLTALAKSGTGVQRLSGTNTYFGATTVSSGTLLVNGDSSGVTNTWTVSAAGTLGGTGTIGGAVTVAASGTLSPGDLNIGRGRLTLANGLKLSGAAKLVFTLTNATTAGVTYDQLAITSGSFTNASVKNTIYPMAPNGTIPTGTYCLITNTIARVSLAPNDFVFSNGLTNWPSTSPTMVLLNGANNVTLAVLSDTAYTNNLEWKGYVNDVWDTTTLNWFGGIYADGFDVTFDDSALNYTVTGGNVAPGAMTFNNNINDYTVSANMGGAGSLTKNSNGTLTLTGTNTFTGDVAMGNAVGSAHNLLTLAGNGRLGSSTSKLNLNFPRYLFTIQDSAVATFTNILLGCQNPGSQQNRLNQTGGTLNCLGTGTGANAAMKLGMVGTYLMTYNLSGGTLNVTNGDLALSLVNANASVLAQSGGTANLKGVYFDNNGRITLSAGTLNLGIRGVTRGGNASTINLVGGTLGAFGDWSSSLPMSLTNTTTVNTLDSFDGATARTITLSGYLAGSGGLTKTGAGTLTLNGTTNSYSGDTIVSGGTLKLGAAGAVSNSPLIAVASGATCDVSSVTGFTVGAAQSLAGKGTVAGNVIVQGRLAPGGTNSVGELQISGNLTLQTGAVLDWDYTLATADVVTIGGTLTLPATATVSINTTNKLPARALLFTAPSGINGASDLSGWTLTAPGNSERLRVSVSGTSVYLVPIRGTFIMFL